MDRSDRKRRAGSKEDSGRPPSKPRRSDEGCRTATDEEVEEFFAIIRRMRDASRRTGGPMVASRDRSPKWSPVFAPEDFAAPESNGATAAAAEDATAAAAAAVAPRLLDLNVEPDRGDLTAPCAPAPA